MKNLKIVGIISAMLVAILILPACGGGNAPLGGALEGEWAQGVSGPPVLRFDGTNWTAWGAGGPALVAPSGTRVGDMWDSSWLPMRGEEGGFSINVSGLPHGSTPGALGNPTSPGVVAQAGGLFGGQVSVRRMYEFRGTFSVHDNRIEFLFEDGTVWFVADIQYTANTLDIGNTRFTRRTAQQQSENNVSDDEIRGHINGIREYAEDVEDVDDIVEPVSFD